MFEFKESILCQDYVTDNPILKSGSWAKLKKDIKGKKIYLFGTGRACSTFIKKYENKLIIQGVFDNSPIKWGTKFCGYGVENPALIKKNAMEMVIIITTTSYMDDVARQLDEMGFTNYYGLAVLESKRKLLRLCLNVMNFVLWKILPVRKNRILITNGFRKYCDNAKYIVDELLKQNVDCEILWMNADPSCTYPEQIKKVPDTVIQKIIAHSTSKIWIDNFKKELWIKKKKGQIYINTWHGSVTFKKLDFDGHNSSPRHLARTEYDSDLIDLRISNGKNCSEMYRRAMRYKGEIMECGTPRLDCLFVEETGTKMKLGIPEDANIVLYAPTWRQATNSGYQGINEIDLDFMALKQILEQKFGGTYYVLIRLHPAAKKVKIEEGNPFIKDMTGWEDVYDLLKVSNVLISDYSSLIFEMGFIRKPVFLYAYDYEQYAREHGVYFQLSELPFPAAVEEKEVHNLIEAFDYDRYLKELDKFNSRILGVTENGTATLKVVERIKSYLK